jgi:hypothetical protein
VIAAAGRMPNLNKIIEELGYQQLLYIVGQGIGSHHVHGTWSSLLFHYLEETEITESETRSEFRFGPRDHNCETHINQFMFVL